ncbi:hypothetical protein AC1031_004472 [Aphanomyces cochlioides]|nr:hypothetical protein AC1031_004472 [Aphanomyces cochlioides]
MTKVQEIRRPMSPTATFTRWSLAYNVIFALNLASTPYMAYLAEPHPGLTGSSQPPPFTSFKDFVHVTSNYFKPLYNDSMPLRRVSRRDFTSNTFGIRRDMTLQYEIPDGDMIDYIIRMPASLYYGQGLRSFLVDFLASNATTRNQTQPWQLCQHGQIVAIDLSDLCVWVQATAQESSYTVWAVTAVLETPESCWAKFVFRTLLTIYVLYVLWARYYRHYVILSSNLHQVGISPQYNRYKIVVGDPAYAILSDPVVSVVMVVDTLWGVSYIAVALIQVTQFQDVWLYVSGCVYLSRGVWFAYLFMQILSAMVKKWRCGKNFERAFASIHPHQILVQARSTKIRPGVSDYSFNDMKAHVLLAMTMEKHTKRSIGGSLHELYVESPHYRKLPLFSHRAADCFVVCYTSDGSLDQRIRLSLLSWFDQQVDDPKFAISKCPSMHSSAVCYINQEGCPVIAPSLRLVNLFTWAVQSVNGSCDPL